MSYPAGAHSHQPSAMALVFPNNSPWMPTPNFSISFSSPIFSSPNSSLPNPFLQNSSPSSAIPSPSFSSTSKNIPKYPDFVNVFNQSPQWRELRRFIQRARRRSCSSSSYNSLRKKRNRNSSKFVEFFDDTQRSGKDHVFSDTGSVMLEGDSKNPEPSSPIKSRGRTFRWFFKKKALWQRIFFASKKLRGIILINVTTIIYASNIPVVKEVEATMDPAAFSAVRFAVSAIPFAPFVFGSKHDAQTRKAGIELGVWVSLGYLMQALGLLTSDAGRSSFISMLTVIVVPLLEGMLGVKVPTLTWIGALMSVIGVGMLESSGSPPCIGDLLNLLSAVFFGVHMLRTERIAKMSQKEDFLPLLGYEVCVLAFLSIMWYSIGSWYTGTQPQGWDPHCWSWKLLWESLVSVPWIPAIYTGAFSTGLCLWVEMSAMQDISATETAIIYGLEPVWGAGFAWFLLGERWGAAGWVGASLILGGSLMVQIFGSWVGEAVEGDSSEKEALQPDIVKPSGLPASTIIITSKRVPDKLEK